jgi:hypothetical protein
LSKRAILAICSADGALFGDVGSDAAEAEELARLVEARRGRQFPPARGAVDRHRNDEVREALAALHPFGHVVQALGEIARLPRIARQGLEQRGPFELVRRRADGEGESRRHMDQAAGVVGLPQPVGRGFLELTQKQADRLGLFVQHFLGAAEADVALREADAEAREQRARGDRDRRLRRRAGDDQRGRGRQADGDDEHQARHRQRVRDDRQREHHQQRDGPHREDMIGRGRQALQPEGRGPHHRRIGGVALAEREFRGTRMMKFAER